MASSAPKIAAQEHFEAPEAVQQKAKALADEIKKSKHFIAFTGAGISTSTGIPDFRGPEGAWTLLAQGRQRTSKATSTLEAIPSPTHMALVQLHEKGLLKYIVSQNCDGLHRKSGINADSISDLHGNSNRECCRDCGKEYIRDFRAVASYHKSVFDHRTGRKCSHCGGALHDTIINFGECLPEEPLRLAQEHAKQADLCLVLGSSLTVSPACDITREAKTLGNASKLVICNLQETNVDDMVDLRIFTKTDDLMMRVMDELKLPIPPFVLRRHLKIRTEPTGNDRRRITVFGVDTDGTPVSFLRSVKLVNNRRVAKNEPFTIDFRGALQPDEPLGLELEFMGHYGEPNLEIEHFVRGQDEHYLLEYSPYTRNWSSVSEKPA